MIQHLRRLTFLVLVGTLSTFALSVAAQSQSVAGTWDVNCQTPHGPMTLEFDLKQDGSTVTGTVLNFRGQRQPVRGEYKNGELTLTSTDGDELAVTATMKTDGSLAGEISVQQGDVALTATRAKKW